MRVSIHIRVRISFPYGYIMGQLLNAGLVLLIHLGMAEENKKKKI